METNVVVTRQKRLREALLVSTYNMSFREENEKKKHQKQYFELKKMTNLSWG